jgi:GMP synthase-like glutamine amidotransferase
MILGILQTGRVSEEASALYGGYLDMFARLFEPRGFELRLFNVVDGDFPAGPGAADAWLITGSPHGVYEDRPWIAPLEAFIRDIRDAGVPLVGICFGHQIVARPSAAGSRNSPAAGRSAGGPTTSRGCNWR